MKEQAKILQEISFGEEDAVKAVHIDFCITSDDLNPAALTTGLEITPSRAWAKDEEYLGKAWDPNARKTIHGVRRKRPSGIWGIDSETAVAGKQVEQHALYLIDLLEPKKDVLAFYLKEGSGYRVRFLIWWEPLDGHGSYAISRETLVRLAELSQYVEFLCIYDEDVEEEISGDNIKAK